MSKIEWTGETWNPFEFLKIPLEHKTPKIYCVDFISKIKKEQIDKFFAVMALTPQHQYQILTRQPELIFEYLGSDLDCDNRIEDWGDEGFKLTGEYERFEEPLRNVRIGITAENQKAWNERSPYLNAIARIGWKTMISFEPLLEEINLQDFDTEAMYRAGFDSEGTGNGLESGYFFLEDCWAIIGGESGDNARLCQIEWMQSISWQCQDELIPVFIKQLGSNHNWKNKCGKKGNEFESFPESLKIREIPEVV